MRNSSSQWAPHSDPSAQQCPRKLFINAKTLNSTCMQTKKFIQFSTGSLLHSRLRSICPAENSSHNYPGLVKPAKIPMFSEGPADCIHFASLKGSKKSKNNFLGWSMLNHKELPRKKSIPTVLNIPTFLRLVSTLNLASASHPKRPQEIIKSQRKYMSGLTKETFSPSRTARSFADLIQKVSKASTSRGFSNLSLD
jgi:hypothetical protein